MAKGTTEFTQENAQRAMQAATVGMGWMQEAAEQSLNQSRVTFETLLAITRKAGDGIDQQASAVRRCSIALAEETFSNAFELGHRMARVKEPQELAQAQCDFLSRQAEIIAAQTRELAQNVAKEASEMSSATVREADAARKRSEAA